jgi:hypothetical protein
MGTSFMEISNMASLQLYISKPFSLLLCSSLRIKAFMEHFRLVPLPTTHSVGKRDTSKKCVLFHFPFPPSRRDIWNCDGDFFCTDDWKGETFTILWGVWLSSSFSAFVWGWSGVMTAEYCCCSSPAPRILSSSSEKLVGFTASLLGFWFRCAVGC